VFTLKVAVKQERNDKKNENTPMVVCTTSSTTTRVLAVFAYSSIAMQYIAPMLANVRKACQHHFFEEGCRCDGVNSVSVPDTVTIIFYPCPQQVMALVSVSSRQMQEEGELREGP
jgi:hypothetical protein